MRIYRGLHKLAPSTSREKQVPHSSPNCGKPLTRFFFLIPLSLLILQGIPCTFVQENNSAQHSCPLVVSCTLHSVTSFATVRTRLPFIAVHSQAAAGRLGRYSEVCLDRYSLVILRQASNVGLFADSVYFVPLYHFEIRSLRADKIHSQKDAINGE